MPVSHSLLAAARMPVSQQLEDCPAGMQKGGRRLDSWVVFNLLEDSPRVVAHLAAGGALDALLGELCNAEVRRHCQSCCFGCTNTIALLS